ncbi:MAG: hypothetical protein LBJ32_01495 [Oscillospiraceae bacterium]|jgi:hypothetical protein|nr:hypothetical protein [Oscillospiraceae bacterium]
MKNQKTSKNIAKKVLISLIWSSLLSMNFAQARKKEINKAINYDDYTQVSANQYVDSNKEKKLFIYYAEDARELSLVVQRAKENDIVMLKNDITLDSPIFIETSIIFDLNGHKITVINDENVLFFGKKTFDHVEKKEIIHPGHWEVQDRFGTKVSSIGTRNSSEFSSVWVQQSTEHSYINFYNYDEKLNSVVKNGEILRAKGQNGKDGIENSNKDYHGKDGLVPNAPLHIISGTVRLENMKIIGGKGGNGGNGKYQSLWHFLFGGGNAGNGGNGANGGRAYSFEKGHGRIVKDNFTVLKNGKGGKGGKKGNVNPNFWFFPGSEGKNGQDGKKIGSEPT